MTTISATDCHYLNLVKQQLRDAYAGVEYCQMCIKETTEAWVKKEYTAVMAERQAEVKSLELRLKNWI